MGVGTGDDTSLADSPHYASALRALETLPVTDDDNPDGNINFYEQLGSGDCGRLCAGLTPLQDYPEDDVRLRVARCLALCLSVHHRLLCIQPAATVTAIVDCVLVFLADDEREVAQEACEWLISFSETTTDAAPLAEHFDEMLPRLQHLTVFTEDMIWVNDAGDAEEVISWQDSRENESESEDEDPSAEWNGRKAAAAAYDALSEFVQARAPEHAEAFLRTTLELISRRLHSQDWLEVESAILITGAIACAFKTEMEPTLPSIVPFLVECMAHEKSLVRSIACWTTSRYGDWICQPGNDLASAVLSRVLELFQNPVIQVRLAASASLSNLLESEGAVEAFAPLVPTMAESLAVAMSCAENAKNLTCVCDAIATLAERGFLKDHQDCSELLLSSFMDQWAIIEERGDGLERLLPLLEALSELVQSAGLTCIPFAQGLHEKGISLVEVSLSSNTHDDNTSESAAAALDLLSSLSEALGENTLQFISETPIVTLVCGLVSAEDIQTDVRLAAFALVGDYARDCYEEIAPFLAEFVPVLLTVAARGDDDRLRQNAIWALGEMTPHSGEDLAPFTEDLAECLRSVFHSHSQRALYGTAAVTAGRLAIKHPQVAMSSFISLDFAQWCVAVSKAEIKEAQHCLEGLSAIANCDDESESLSPAMPHIALLINSFTEENFEEHPRVRRAALKLMRLLKLKLHPDEWCAAPTALPLREGVFAQLHALLDDDHELFNDEDDL